MSKENNVHLTHRAGDQSGRGTSSVVPKSSPLSGEGILPEGFIGKKEVARRLNKGIRTVDYWMERGILPYYKIGRSVVFKWCDVESHLARTCRIPCLDRNQHSNI